eukprot:PhM_4_TR3070/c1_g1_i2/m.102474
MMVQVTPVRVVLFLVISVLFLVISDRISFSPTTLSSSSSSSARTGTTSTTTRKVVFTAREPPQPQHHINASSKPSSPSFPSSFLHFNNVDNKSVRSFSSFMPVYVNDSRNGYLGHTWIPPEGRLPYLLELSEAEEVLTKRYRKTNDVSLFPFQNITTGRSVSSTPIPKQKVDHLSQRVNKAAFRRSKPTESLNNSNAEADRNDAAVEALVTSLLQPELLPQEEYESNGLGCRTKTFNRLARDAEATEEAMTSLRRSILQRSTAFLGSAPRVYINGTRDWSHVLPDHRQNAPTHIQQCQSVIVRMLHIFSIVMDEYGIGSSWFLSHATLLGAVRYGHMVPWDIDIDIAVTESAMEKLEKIWVKEFPRDMFLQTRVTDPKYLYQVGVFRDVNRLQDRYSCFPGYNFVKYKKGYRYHHTGPQIDIIPIYGRSRWRGGKMLLQSFIPKKEWLWPTKKMCFEGLALPVPRNTSAVLTAMYGSDYMTPPKELYGPRYSSLSHAMACRAVHRCPKSKWGLSYEADFNRSTGEMVVTAPRADPFQCKWVRARRRTVCSSAATSSNSEKKFDTKASPNSSTAP